jgi:P-type Ca2+ transporter type 2C
VGKRPLVSHGDPKTPQGGTDEIAWPEHRTAVHIVIDVFREPMFVLLVGAGVLCLFLGDIKESLILCGV